MSDAIYMDSFDHNTDEPRGLRGESLDRHVLSTAARISIFWITETQARASRIQRWEKTGVLVLDNESEPYPWIKVVSFNPDNRKEHENG